MGFGVANVLDGQGVGQLERNGTDVGMEADKTGADGDGVIT